MRFVNPVRFFILAAVLLANAPTDGAQSEQPPTRSNPVVYDVDFSAVVGQVIY